MMNSTIGKRLWPGCVFGFALFCASVANAQLSYYFRDLNGTAGSNGNGTTTAFASQNISVNSYNGGSTVTVYGYSPYSFGVTLVGLAGSPLAVGVYDIDNPQGLPEFAPEIYVNANSGCATRKGRMHVREISSTVSGQITALAVDFEKTCSPVQGPTYYGQLRYNSTIPIDTTRRGPNAILFTDQLGVPPGSIATSNAVTISGLDVPAALTITGGEYSLNGGAFATDAVPVTNGDVVRVRLAAPGENNRDAAATLRLNNYFTRFQVTTVTGQAPQPAGDPLVTIVGLPQLNGTGKTSIYSPGTLHDVYLMKSPYHPSRGIRVQAKTRDAGGGYGNGVWSMDLAGATGPVAPGEQMELAINTTSGGAYFIANDGNPNCYYAVSGRVSVLDIAYDPQGIPSKLALDYVIECGSSSSGYSRIYGHVRINSTQLIDYSIKDPIPFNFPGVRDAALDTAYASAVGTAQGITEPVTISIQGGEYSVAAGAYRSDTSTISNGQSVKVRLTSASTPNTLKTAVLKMGSMEFPFRVGTAPGAAPQPVSEPMLMVVGIPLSSAQPVAAKLYSAAQLNRFVFSKDYWGGKTNNLLIFSSFDTNPTPNTVGIASFSGPNNTYLQTGSFQLVPTPDGPLLPVVDFSTTPGCYYYGATSRKLVVHEVEYGAGDVITKLALDLVTECGPNSGDMSMVFHYLRFNSALPIDYARNTPAPFAFAPSLGVPPSSTQTSAGAHIFGINAAVPVSVSGGEYSIGDSAFTSVSGTISNDQTLRLRGVASGEHDTLSEVTVNVGGRVVSYRIGTATTANPQPRADSPLIVMYSQARDGALTNRTLSKATLFTIAPSPAVVNWAVMAVDAAPGNPQPTSASFVFIAGADIAPGTYVQDPSAGHPSFGVNINTLGDLPRCSMYYYGDSYVPRAAKFVVHEIERTVTGQLTKFAADAVETCAYDPQTPTSSPTAAIFSFIRFNSTVPIDHAIKQPVPLVFSPVLWQTPQATVESNAATVVGVTEPVPVSVAPDSAGLEFSIDGGAYAATPRNIAAGQSLKLRTKAPATMNSTLTNVIRVGDGQASFFIGTEPGLGPNSGGNPLIHVISQGSEPIGRGANYQFSPATRNRIVSSRLTYNYPTFELLRVEVFGDSGISYSEWGFQFGGADGVPLELGTYENPQYYSQAGLPHMSVRGKYGSCGPLGAGSKFIVREISLGASSIDKLAIDFVSYCSGYYDPLYGYIRINSSIPITLVSDSDPTPFTIPPANNVLRNTLVTSSAVTVTGFTVPTPISIVGGEYSLGNGAFTSAPGIMSPGQTLRVRVLSPSGFSAQSKATVTAGAQSADFNVYTGYQDLYPDSLAFATVDNAPRSSMVESAIETVNDINDIVTLSVNTAGIEFSVAGQPFTSANTPLQPGQTLQLRLQSAGTYSTLKSGSVNVGYKTVPFSVRTAAQAVIVATIVGNGSVVISPLGLNCSQTCSSLLDQGTTVTLVATPGAGLAFTGWSGAGCSGTGVCMITVGLTASVTATFATLPPSAPTLVQAIAGNGSATFKLLPPAFTGGATIGMYTVSCMPGALTTSASSTTLVLTGLANGTAYSCSATATNAGGTSPPSSVMTVTPSASIPFALIAVKSRKTHGASQEFELDVDPTIAQTGAISVEPRIADAGHQIVFQFNAAVTSVSTLAAVDETNGTVAIAGHSMSGTELRVTLTGGLDKRRVKISLSGVNGTLDTSASVGFLLGDVNLGREVLQSGYVATRSRTGQMAAQENFVYDINLTGKITAADALAVRKRIGNKLP